jgi:fibro-slime domain-containing protein
VTRIILGATVALLALVVAVRFDPLPQGLTATYFADANWSSAPVRSIRELQPSTDGLRAAWHGNPPESFSATWIGSLLASHSGNYTFESDSDDGAWLYIDGRLIVDDGGRHADLPASGTVHLDRGVHEIFVRYFQAGGDYAFGLRWAIDGGSLQTIPAWALWTRRVEFSRMLISAWLRRALAIGFAVWCGLVVAWLLALIAPPTRRGIAYVWSDPSRRTLAAIVAASALLNVAGIWWGLPSAWAGDELTPKPVMIALSRHFSAGWFDRYPPLHFYVLTIAYSPWLLVDAMGWAHLTDLQQTTLLSLAGRLVSVAAAAGTLVAVYVSGAYAFGRRAGLWAAAAMALVPIFVFYAKTANPEVPYVFWFALSLAFYLRALQTGALRDVVAFGICAVMAICTKDQAYALFISMPFGLMYRWRSVVDRRLFVGGAAAAAVFIAVQNIPLNAYGFVAHVRDITGPGSNYRMVEPTIAGQLALLRLSAILDVRSWGWPLALSSVAGFAIALRERRTRADAVLLALVAATYYVGFIAVVLYNYDRYLLPICVVQALFAGLALDRLTVQSAARWRRAVAGIAIAYSVLYAATVDVLMIGDTRYDAEAWLRVHAGREKLVAMTFPDVVNPRTFAYRSVEIHSTGDLARWAPDYFVLNADYARAIAPHRPEFALIGGLQHETLGYHRVYRYRTSSLWPWLPGGHPDLVGPRLDTHVLSFLRDLSPTIEIYERERS